MGKGDSPYKGLMPYSEDDAPFFFGREKCREIITDNLMASRLTLFYGASGVGKSSVLRAGVTYHLNQQARENLEKEGAPRLAVIVFNNWGDDPLASLIQQVRTDIQNLFGNRPVEPVTASPRLVQVLQTWTQRLAGADQPGELFIILDQFEEYFLYHPQEDGEGTFAAEFPRAVNSPDLHVNFLVLLREDSFTKLDRFKGRIPKLYSNQLRIEHLDEESASDAIRKPIQEYNRRQPPDHAPVGVEPRLVQAVLDEVKAGRFHIGEEGRGRVAAAPETTQANRIETAYLQLVMTRLWEEEIAAGSRRLRLETLQRLGGAVQIVKKHLNAQMKRLPAEMQDIAAHIFTYLVTPSGTKIAHAVGDLVTYVREEREEAGIKPERPQVQALLEELSKGASRILRPIGPSSRNPQAGERYEIFHNVLGPAIMEWHKRYISRQRFEAVRKDRRKKNFRILSGVVVFVAVLFTILYLELQSALDNAKLQAENLEKSEQQAAVFNLDSEGLNAWKTFESARQLDALLSAMQTVQKAKESGLLERTSSPLWALQQILSVIQQTDKVEIVPTSDGIGFSADFSPSTRRLATISREGLVSVCDFEGKKGFDLPGGSGWGTRVRFSPDGQSLAIASRDGRIRLWDGDGKRRAKIKHDGGKPVISFSPDGERLVTTAQDGTVRFWDLKGRLLKEFKGSNHRTSEARRWSAASLSPDGESIALAAMDGTVRIRDLLNRNQASKHIRVRSPKSCSARTAECWRRPPSPAPSVCGPPAGMA